MRFIIRFILAFLCLASMTKLQTAFADEMVNFSVKAIHSDKQVNENVSYFDLMLSPGEEHVLEIDIYNNHDKPMDFSVAACTAGTTPNGVIEYDNTEAADDSLLVSFAEAATVEKPVVSVPAGGKNRARVNIKMPEIIFDGIILGGIIIKQAEITDVVERTGGTSIMNEYCYVTAVKIGVNNVLVEPEFKLKGIEPSLSNYHTGIAASLQNENAALAKDMKIDANVYYNNEPNPVYSNSSSDFDVAPNSTFDYFIPSSGRLPAGEYRLLLTAEHEDRTWEFDETFSITATAANDVNNQAVNVPGVNYYLVAAVFLSLLLIAAIAVIVWMRINRDKRRQY